MIGLAKDALADFLSARGQRARSYGLLAEFKTTAELYHACEKVRDAGYTRWDAHTPFPVHGLDKAMGLRPSPLPFIVFIGAMIGAGGGFYMQKWVSEDAYKLVISGKPFFSWPAFIPVTFELGVLFGALSALLGMLALNQLPRLHHPLFASKRFERASDDRFFVSIESADPKYDAEATKTFLEGLHATAVEVVED
jgi:hypothetical protein